jgi:hypothetical protein
MLAIFCNPKEKAAVIHHPSTSASKVAIINTANYFPKNQKHDCSQIKRTAAKKQISRNNVDESQKQRITRKINIGPKLSRNDRRNKMSESIGGVVAYMTIKSNLLSNDESARLKD